MGKKSFPHSLLWRVWKSVDKKPLIIKIFFGRKRKLPRFSTVCPVDNVENLRDVKIPIFRFLQEFCSLGILFRQNTSAVNLPPFLLLKFRNICD